MHLCRTYIVHIIFSINCCSRRHDFRITHCIINNEMAFDVPKVVAPDALGDAMLYDMLYAVLYAVL